MGRRARSAAPHVAGLDARTRNGVLAAMAVAVIESQDSILAANTLDCASAKAAGLSAALIDRLLLDPSRIEAMADGLRRVAALPDPLGIDLAARKHRKAAPQLLWETGSGRWVIGGFGGECLSPRGSDLRGNLR